MDGYLSKPVSADTLHGELAKWLPMATEPPRLVADDRVISDEPRVQEATRPAAVAAKR